MRYYLLLACVIFIFCGSVSASAPAPDIARYPSCSYCGMDRGKFSQSRMLIEYEDGSAAPTCSLHCAAAELANTIDRVPAAIRVADFQSRELIDGEQAVWVLGGKVKGVMTAQPKWAFATESSADRFIKENGGRKTGFEEAIKGAYDDMYQDTRMIREFRRMQQMEH